MPGMIVADLGVGSGFYSLHAAKLVGDRGKVYAIDIQKDLLDRIRLQATKDRRYNVETIWGDCEKLGGTKLREMLVDVAIAANILFQLEKKDVFAQEVSRVIKRGGKLVVVDWTDSFNNLGPHADHVFTKAVAEELFKKHGFAVEKEIDAGAHHYGMIFSKQ